MKYTLAIDQSTSATKVMLFDENTKLCARESIDHQQYYPQPGWVEHDPVEILSNTYRIVEKLLANSRIVQSDIRNIAITNQRETVVVWDKNTGQPVYNAIVWQCIRGAAICDGLADLGFEPMVREKTGLIINPYFSASGVKWILDNVKGTLKEAQKGNLLLGTMDSWLIWHFTSGKIHATDYTNACRTMLFNIKTLKWDRELLDLLGIPPAMMPETLPCDSIFGTTTLHGLLQETPIAGVLGDSHGALVGQKCYAKGLGKATYGTGSSIAVNIGEKALSAPKGLVTSIGFTAKGKVYYEFEGNIHCTGATIKWLQDELQLIKDASESEALATSVESTGGVYLVPAFAGLGAPWWDNEARALICGMTRGTNKAHIVRAALESIAYQIKDLIVLMQESGLEIEELRVDGGPVKNKFLMDFQADILQTRINPNPIEEASALGAVIMGGLALDHWSALEEIGSQSLAADSILPKRTFQEMEVLYEGWKKAVKRTLSS